MQAIDRLSVRRPGSEPITVGPAFGSLTEFKKKAKHPILPEASRRIPNRSGNRNWKADEAKAFFYRGRGPGISQIETDYWEIVEQAQEGSPRYTALYGNDIPTDGQPPWVLPDAVGKSPDNLLSSLKA